MAHEIEHEPRRFVRSQRRLDGLTDSSARRLPGVDDLNHDDAGRSIRRDQGAHPEGIVEGPCRQSLRVVHEAIVLDEAAYREASRRRHQKGSVRGPDHPLDSRRGGELPLHRVSHFHRSAVEDAVAGLPFPAGPADLNRKTSTEALDERIESHDRWMVVSDQNPIAVLGMDTGQTRAEHHRDRAQDRQGRPGAIE